MSRIRAAAILLAFVPGPALVADENPWPAIRKARLQKLLPDAMSRAGVDA